MKLHGAVGKRRVLRAAGPDDNPLHLTSTFPQYIEDERMEMGVDVWLATAKAAAGSGSFQQVLAALESLMCVPCAKYAKRERILEQVLSQLAHLMHAAAALPAMAIDAAPVLQACKGIGQPALLAAQSAVLEKASIAAMQHGPPLLGRAVPPDLQRAAVELMDAASAHGAAPSIPVGVSAASAFEAASQQYWAAVLRHGGPSAAADACLAYPQIGLTRARYRRGYAEMRQDDPARAEVVKESFRATDAKVLHACVEAGAVQAASMSITQLNRVVRSVAKATTLEVQLAPKHAPALIAALIAKAPDMSIYEVQGVLSALPLQQSLRSDRSAEALVAALSDVIVREAPAAPAFTPMTADGQYHEVGIAGYMGLLQTLQFVKATAPDLQLSSQAVRALAERVTAIALDGNRKVAEQVLSEAQAVGIMAG